jgi:hypothetical protein
MSTSKGSRVISRKDGRRGEVVKVIGNCLWVKMDDGTEWSGGKPYWKPEPKKKGFK